MSQVRFSEPSHLMYGDETGQSSATATFAIGGTEGPATIQVLLPNHTFIPVGSHPLGGLELISIQISGSIDEKIVPEKDFNASANSWCVLQHPLPGPGRPFELEVFNNGETQ